MQQSQVTSGALQSACNIFKLPGGLAVSRREQICVGMSPVRLLSSVYLKIWEKHQLVRQGHNILISVDGYHRENL